MDIYLQLRKVIKLFLAFGSIFNSQAPTGQHNWLVIEQVELVPFLNYFRQS
jgi:hypothetical protein